MFHLFGERSQSALVVVLSTLVACGATAFGQVTSGSVTGSVQDAPRKSVCCRPKLTVQEDLCLDSQLGFVWQYSF